MSIQKVLSPLLMISYLCGSRLIEFPAGIPRQWFGLLYMLLLWSLYNFIYIYAVIPYTINYSTLYHIWVGVNMFTTLLSIIVGIYHEKAFRNCIKNITTVDDTLEELGTITDYKLRKKIIWLIVGWVTIVIVIICEEIMLLKYQRSDIFTQVIHIPFVRNYCTHINVIGDLILTSMLGYAGLKGGYVGLKFDQINEHLQKLTIGNKRNIKRDWQHHVLPFSTHQSRYVKALRSKYMIWIVIHLYSELRKISRQIDLIFGIQMTIEMGTYFAYIALGLQEIFNAILIKDYEKDHKVFYLIIILVILYVHIFRLFLINCECERVRIKANATRNFISNLSYSNDDVEIRENILQFLLMTRSPFRFCGLGLFQFGFKFLQGFTTSTVTVLILLLQTHTNK